MSFRPIRKYFEDRLLTLDSDYKQHVDAFNIDNIGELNFDKAYHIFYGNATTSFANQNQTNDNVSVTVTLFSNGHRDPSEALDSTMDFANEFRIECLKPKYCAGLKHLKQVRCDNIAATPGKGNDNAIIVKLKFSCSMVFGIGAMLDDL